MGPQTHIAISLIPESITKIATLCSLGRAFTLTYRVKALVIRKGQMKVPEIARPFKKVNQKQHLIPEYMAGISVTLKFLMDCHIPFTSLVQKPDGS